MSNGERKVSPGHLAGILIDRALEDIAASESRRNALDTTTRSAEPVST